MGQSTLIASMHAQWLYRAFKSGTCASSNVHLSLGICRSSRRCWRASGMHHMWLRRCRLVHQRQRFATAAAHCLWCSQSQISATRSHRRHVAFDALRSSTPSVAACSDAPLLSSAHGRSATPSAGWRRASSSRRRPPPRPCPPTSRTWSRHCWRR